MVDKCLINWGGPAYRSFLLLVESLQNEIAKSENIFHPDLRQIKVIRQPTWNWVCEKTISILLEVPQATFAILAAEIDFLWRNDFCDKAGSDYSDDNVGSFPFSWSLKRFLLLGNQTSIKSGGQFPDPTATACASFESWIPFQKRIRVADVSKKSNDQLDIFVTKGQRIFVGINSDYITGIVWTVQLQNYFPDVSAVLPTPALIFDVLWEKRNDIRGEYGDKDISLCSVMLYEEIESFSNIHEDSKVYCSLRCRMIKKEEDGKSQCFQTAIIRDRSLFLLYAPIFRSMPVETILGITSSYLNKIGPSDYKQVITESTVIYRLINSLKYQTNNNNNNDNNSIPSFSYSTTTISSTIAEVSISKIKEEESKERLLIVSLKPRIPKFSLLGFIVAMSEKHKIYVRGILMNRQAVQICDHTGKIDITAWGNIVYSLENLNVGQLIYFQNLYTTEIKPATGKFCINAQQEFKAKISVISSLSAFLTSSCLIDSSPFSSLKLNRNKKNQEQVEESFFFQISEGPNLVVIENATILGLATTPILGHNICQKPAKRQPNGRLLCPVCNKELSLKPKSSEIHYKLYNLRLQLKFNFGKDQEETFSVDSRVIHALIEMEPTELCSADYFKEIESSSSSSSSLSTDLTENKSSRSLRHQIESRIVGRKIKALIVCIVKNQTMKQPNEIQKPFYQIECAMIV